MATTNNTNEPGIIGQMYEHRKTHKIGVLESREVKYKTLMFRDKDGGSFTTTYSTFRSDWRKYTGDEVIAETSTQVEEKKETPVEPEKKETKVKKERATKKESIETRQEILSMTEDAFNLVKTAIEKAKKEFVVKIGGRGGLMNCVRVKNGRKNILEFWFNKDTFVFFTNKEVWERMEFPEKFGEVTADVHDNFNLKYESVFNEKAMQAVIKIAVAAI